MSDIYQAIASIMKKGYSIAKEKDNKTQNFKYRGIDDVMNTFQPIMAEAGIFLVPEVLEHSREERSTKSGGNLIYSVIKMKYTFYAEDGSNVSAVVIGEGMDSADKSSNKAMAVAMKYAMFQTFCIPTEDMASDDPNKETPPESKPQTAQKPAQKPAENKPAPAPKPKAESAQKTQTAPPPKADGYWYCDDCGEIISTTLKKDGTKAAPLEIVELSFKKTKKCLCADCLKKYVT